MNRILQRVIVNLIGRSKFRLRTLTVIVVTTCGFTGASAQPREYVVVYSSTITSGPYAGDADIVECRFNGLGEVAHPADSVRSVAAQTLRELEPVAEADCNGGYVLAYTVDGGDSASAYDRDVFVRRIDSLGNDVWAIGGVPYIPVAQSRVIEERPHILMLSDGSLLIAYEVRYGGNRYSDIDIAAVRIGLNGVMLVPPFWAAKSKKRERIAALVPNGSGGAYIVINSETFRDTLLTNADVLMQRVDPFGTVGWKDSPEPVVVAASKHLERNAAAVADGQRGVYIAYEVEYVGEGRAGEIDLLAQRMGEYGRRRWISDTALPIVSSSPRSIERRPSLTAVGDGIVVGFEFAVTGDARPISAVGLQKLDTNGRPMWNDGRKSKLIALARSLVGDVTVASDGRGGSYVLFSARDTATGDDNVAMQHLTSTGEPLWGEGVAPILVFDSPEDETEPTMIVDVSGEVTVLAIRSPEVLGRGAYTAIVGSRLTYDGDAAWQPVSIIVATTPSEKSRPLVISCN